MIDKPITLNVLNVPRVWGGDRIAREFSRETHESGIGESWEVHGELQVSGSDLTLDQLVQRYGSDFLGTRVDASGGFPLLTKWLDCSEWLSVQVHPDDNLAQVFTGDPKARGKTEAWYIHRADQHAELIHGLAEGVSVDSLRHLQGEQLLPSLRRQRPVSGQLLHTPAGVVHALGPGNLLYEVQQSSDLTYRLYDWGRDREIHFERSLECMERSVAGPGHVTEDQLSCPYFEIDMLRRAEEWSLDGSTVQILVSTQGRLELNWSGGRIKIAAGQSVILPASLGKVSVDGDLTEPALRIQIPEAVW